MSSTTHPMPPIGRHQDVSCGCSVSVNQGQDRAKLVQPDAFYETLAGYSAARPDVPMPLLKLIQLKYLPGQIRVEAVLLMRLGLGCRPFGFPPL